MPAITGSGQARQRRTRVSGYACSPLVTVSPAWSLAKIPGTAAMCGSDRHSLRSMHRKSHCWRYGIFMPHLLG